MSDKKNIVVLGATGSIGTQTLDVARKHSDKINVVGLVAHSSEDKLNELAKEFNVEKTILVKNYSSESDATEEILNLINDNDTEIVVNAISGAVGLQASYETLKINKRLALANKESLVVGGDLLMSMSKNNLLPIDSEHGAIYQCLTGEEKSNIYKIHLTASGGPFFGAKKEDLENVTATEALKHPTWNMGPKITIDSATLMNKGLEVIEAHHLFGVDYDQINVVVQPQSAIHSMVEYNDGSIKAHLGTTDMRIPIQYALSYPDRWDTPVERMDFSELAKIDFDKPDCLTFKCLHLAFQAGKAGGIMPCVMNAANEVAVVAFLQHKIKFLQIPEIIEKTMSQFSAEKVENLEQLIDVDQKAREISQSAI